MSGIRIKALDKLSALLECEVKELKGKICAGPSGRDHRLSYPSLAINPLRFAFEPHQATFRDPTTGECYETALNKQALVKVGDWVGTIELRLGARTAAARCRLEEDIETVFLGGFSSFMAGRTDPVAGECARVGVALVDIPECYGARVSFELEDSVWENEKVFNKQWYSVLRITAIIPAFVLKSPVHTIDTLKLSLTEDLETVATPTSGPESETVNIAEDGTIS